MKANLYSYRSHTKRNFFITLLLALFFLFSGLYGVYWWILREHRGDLLRRSSEILQVIKKNSGAISGNSGIADFVEHYKIENNFLAYILIWDEKKIFSFAQTYLGGEKIKKFVKERMDIFRKEKTIKAAPGKFSSSISGKIDDYDSIYLFSGGLKASNNREVYFEIGHLFLPLNDKGPWLALFFVVIASLTLIIFINFYKFLVKPESHLQPGLARGNALKPEPNPIERYNITVDKNDSTILKEILEEPRIIPGKSEITPKDLLAGKYLEFDKINDPKVILSDNFSLKLGRGRENIKTRKIDFSKFRGKYLRNKKKNKQESDLNSASAGEGAQVIKKLNPEIIFYNESTIDIR